MKKLLFSNFFLVINILVGYTNTLSVSIHGVDAAKIKLSLAFGGKSIQLALQDEFQISKNEIAKFEIDTKQLPISGVITYSFINFKTMAEVKTEHSIILSGQDISLNINPMYASNPDSVLYDQNEVENNLLKKFLKESRAKKEAIQLMQFFLINYPNGGETLFKLMAQKYYSEAVLFNNWIDAFINKYNQASVSAIFQLHKIPNFIIKGSIEERQKKWTKNYFQNVAFKDTNLLALNGEFNKYLDMYLLAANTRLAKNPNLRETVITEMLVSILEKSKIENSEVCGYIVDYYYAGLQKAKFNNSIKALQPYINNPSCKSQMTESINRNITRNEKVIAGNIAPDFEIEGNKLLSEIGNNAKYKLLVFWSADCDHCIKELDKFNESESATLDLLKNVNIIALSIDQEAHEIVKWEKQQLEYNKWLNFRAKEGIRSKPAVLYGVEQTPTMVLIETSTKKVVSLIKNLDELKVVLAKEKQI